MFKGVMPRSRVHLHIITTHVTWRLNINAPKWIRSYLPPPNFSSVSKTAFNEVKPHGAGMEGRENRRYRSTGELIPEWDGGASLETPARELGFSAGVWFTIQRAP